VILKHADYLREPDNTETVIRPWNFLAPFGKKWDSRFDNGPVPNDDSSYLDELRQFTPKSEGVELFVQSYDEDTISPDKEAIVKLCRDADILDLDQQDKESIWLDDRTFAAYFPGSSAPTSSQNRQNDDPISAPHERAPNTHDGELITEIGPMVVGPSQPDSASAKYSPTSRRYLGPLTAQKLYKELKKKVVIPYPIKLSGSRFRKYVQQQHLSGCLGAATLSTM
jgi:hypothetical protein